MKGDVDAKTGKSFAIVEESDRTQFSKTMKRLKDLQTREERDEDLHRKASVAYDLLQKIGWGETAEKPS